MDANRIVVAFTIVEAVAVYAGTWFVCLYWPLFIHYLARGAPDLRFSALAGILIMPLGFMILGLATGRRMALVHTGLLILAGGGVYAVMQTDAQDPGTLLATAVEVAGIVCYALAAIYRMVYRLRLQPTS